jgi:hypothetical protein
MVYRMSLRIKRIKRRKALEADSRPVTRYELSTNKGRRRNRAGLNSYFIRTYTYPANQVWEPFFV